MGNVYRMLKCRTCCKKEQMQSAFTLIMFKSDEALHLHEPATLNTFFCHVHRCCLQHIISDQYLYLLGLQLTILPLTTTDLLHCVAHNPRRLYYNQTNIINITIFTKHEKLIVEDFWWISIDRWINYWKIQQLIWERRRHSMTTQQL